HFNMPVYTEETRPEIKKIANIKNDGYNEKSLHIFSHTGTHMDSPKHMIENGKSLYEFEINKFIGKAFLLDVSNLLQDNIEINILKKYEKEIKKSEFLIIKTGWEKYWNSEKYFYNFPVLTEEAANWICKFNLKGIGVDTISIDKVDSIHFKIHKIIFSKDMIIIENLTNLSTLTIKKFTFCATPLKYENSDGSPVRAIAITNK
ncbi:cyclase family protein, partial [Clostridium tarantellae]